jgi:hypothetical protein
MRGESRGLSAKILVTASLAHITVFRSGRFSRFIDW